MKLTRREVVLVDLLLVLAIVGGSYYFIYRPLSERHQSLTAERASLEGQQMLVNIELMGKESLEDRRDDALASAQEDSIRFLPSIEPDTLLLETSRIIQESGLVAVFYGIAPVSPTFVDPPVPGRNPPPGTFIAEMARQYREMKNPTPTPTPDPNATPTPEAPTPTPPANIDDSVLSQTLDLALFGTYEQLVDFLGRLEALDRTLVVSQLDLSPVQVEVPIDEETGLPIEVPVDPEAPVNLSITMTLTYYAIDRLDGVTVDPLVDWTRPPVPGKANPFVTIVQPE